MPNAQNSIAYVTVSVAVFVTLPVGGGDMLAFFSIHLKTLRVAKKLTQDQVADYVGVSRSVISAYENDMRLELSIFVQCLNPQNYAASANGCSRCLL